MKLIDKYILRTFLVPMAYCFIAFVLIYVLYDMFGHLDNFIEARTPVLTIAKFYAFLIPSKLWIIMPITLMLAVLYSLFELTRHNELTAMRASGISLYRLLIPNVIVGVLISLFVATIDETIGQRMNYWSAQLLEAETRAEQETAAYIEKSLSYRNPDDGKIWHVQEFDTREEHSYLLRGVTIDQPGDGYTEFKILADRAEWLDGRWWFFGVTIQRWNPNGSPVVNEETKGKKARKEMTALSETPNDFLHAIKQAEFMTARELDAYLERSGDRISPEARSSLQTDLHYRLARPWACFIATLLGIPFGFQTARKGVFVGIILCFSAFFGYYIFVMSCYHLGKSQQLTPIISAWLPNCVFLSAGLAMLARMRQ